MRVDRRLEEVAKAVGAGYCRLQMPLRLALGVRGTVAGHRLGALGGGGYLPPSNASLPAAPLARTWSVTGAGCPRRGTSSECPLGSAILQGLPHFMTRPGLSLRRFCLFFAEGQP